jgi:hypothetical protein
MTEPVPPMIFRKPPRVLEDACIECGKSAVFCAANRDHNAAACCEGCDHL